MDENGVVDQSLEAALAPGTQPPVGRYRLDLSTGRWAWSDEVFEMHGFRPGEVVPTTELMLSHKHPEDRDRVDHALKKAAATGEAFSSVHRIRDAHGGTRTLAVTGQGRRDPDTGEVTELFGYFIDVTEANREIAQREATASIQASAKRRAAIEQAKGVLMVSFGVDGEEAFEHLRTASNQLNVPVRDLATWLVHWFSGSGMTTFPTADQVREFLANPVPVTEQEDPGPAAGVVV
ncbi:PAS and ANTAR domain-containing protein [Isoptericola sp. F-RaC21]|uniref:PAS and ANTAR domain-containing protein n=1 Tax=Isoptericola sp. F-RaC21 TaxID=3141452 RepID=UPI00315C0043